MTGEATTPPEDPHSGYLTFSPETWSQIVAVLKAALVPQRVRT